MHTAIQSRCLFSDLSRWSLSCYCLAQHRLLRTAFAHAIVEHVMSLSTDLQTMFVAARDVMIE